MMMIIIIVIVNNNNNNNTVFVIIVEACVEAHRTFRDRGSAVPAHFSSTRCVREECVKTACGV